MSYILDALRRADADRGRGAVPGLHTPAAPAPLPVGGPRTAVAVAALATGLALLAAGGWWWWLRDDAPRGGVVPAAQVASAPADVAPVPPAPSAPAGSSTPPPAAAETSAPTATVPRAPVDAPGAGPSRRADAAPAPASAPASAARAPAPAPAPVSGSRDRAVAQVQAPAAPPATTVREAPARAPAPVAAAVPKAPAPAPAATPAAVPEPAVRVPALSELPESVRRQLPPLAVSGATYSSNPRYRMVIVNGQVLNEGDPAGADVVLERIEPRAAVLRFKGQRFSVPY